jgi:hypothetical protein
MRTHHWIFLAVALAIAGIGRTADTTPPNAVFVKGTELYSMSAEGTNLTRLAEGGGADLPRWSPDGRRIAYITGAKAAMGRFIVIAADGTKLTELTIRPDEAHVRGMRFIEKLTWLDKRYVVLGGSVNPYNCEDVVLDTETGDEIEWHFGVCGTFVRSPNGKSTAYWGTEAMAPIEEKRETLVVSGAVVCPRTDYPQVEDNLQFLSNPSWAADSQRVALVDRDVKTDQVCITVLDTRPEHATGERRSFDAVAKWAPILMHAPLVPAPDGRVEVHWIGDRIVVTKKDGEALYEADPARGTVLPAAADALESLVTRRAKAAQLKARVAALVRKLGGREDQFDIWPPPDTADTTE